MRLFADIYGNYSVLQDSEIAVVPYKSLTPEDITNIEEASDSDRILIVNELASKQDFTWTDVYDTLLEAIRLCEQPATAINQWAIKEALYALKEALGYNE